MTSPDRSPPPAPADRDGGGGDDPADDGGDDGGDDPADLDGDDGGDDPAELDGGDGSDGDDDGERAVPPDTYADLGPWWRTPPGVDLGLDAHLDEHGQPRIVERHFTVSEDFAGLRLDHYLVRMIPRLSRTRIQAIIRTQLVRGDGRPFRPSSTVAPGDTWVIRRPARPEPPCPRTFEVLYRDDDVLVIDKPAGLPVHASAKFYFNTLARVVAERFPDQPWQICHRLDRETSGALVLASSKPAAAVLKGAFAGKQAAKTYLAVVHGDPPWPDLPAGAEPLGDDDRTGDHVLDGPLVLAGPGDPTALPGVRMLVRADGLPAVTAVRVVRRVPGHALVRCRLITGRQHQIRAHVAHAGHPIVGDKLYGHGDAAFMAFCDRGMTRELAERFVLPRHALHAARVRVPHPTRAGVVDVTCPLAWDLAAFLDDRGTRAKPAP